MNKSMGKKKKKKKKKNKSDVPYGKVATYGQITKLTDTS
jgi:alkylated DNA nucleotide flippase Atl1